MLELGLPFDVLSEDGKTYSIDIWQPDLGHLNVVWEQYQQYRVLFSDVVVGDFAQFVDAVMDKGTVVLEVFCEEKRVGLVYATDLRVNGTALGHFVFWDRKTRGRQRVVLTTLLWGMKELSLHKINMTVPVYAFAALRRIYHMGIRIEGRRREAILYQGARHDLLEFGVLRSEITPAALANARLVRTIDEDLWHGLIQSDPLLMRKVLGVRDELPTRSEADVNRPDAREHQTDPADASGGYTEQVPGGNAEEPLVLS